MIKLVTRWAGLALVTAALTVAIGLVTMGSSTATAPVSATSTLLARGADLSAGTIPIDQGADVAVVTVVFASGGSTGWHFHPGGAIVIVKSGQITLYRSVGNRCDTTTYMAGQAFIERPGDVHDAVNTGSSQAVAYVTFPSVPVGGAPRISVADPGTCPGI